MLKRILTLIFLIFAAALLLGFTLVSEPNHQANQNTGRLIRSIEGPALYKAYCAVCHGTDGRGNGPMASALKVQPPDLTRIAERNGGAFPMARVENIISGEQNLSSGHGTREMPIWGPIFSRVDRDQDLGRVRIDNLTRYLRDMQTVAAAAAAKGEQTAPIGKLHVQTR
jgi:mono/diheme cytochrome c family protein